MDGRKGMALQGSSSYYLHRAIASAAGGSGSVQSGFNPPPGFRHSSNPSVPVQQIGRGTTSVDSTFHVDGSTGNIHQGFDIGMPSGGSLGSEQPIKKKRGRPRKYGPDGSGPGSMLAPGSGAVSLGLSPSSPNSGGPGEKRKRGRPPGSGRKQRLASVGEWMSSSAGLAFTPHVIFVDPGEDIASKILAFSQQRNRALCIMSGSGAVSAVTLRHPSSSGSTLTFEGRFEILCMSGSFLLAETGGPRNRTGGVNISLCGPDGLVIGGAVEGRLIAARPVQVVACSFMYGGTKGKEKTEADSQDGTPNLGPPSVTTPWTGSNPRNPNTDIDLARG